MRQATLLVIVAAFLSGCQTTQKAVAYLQAKQQMASECARLYPCSPGASDSSDYKRALHEYDSIFVIANARWDSMEYANSLLRSAIDSAVRKGCDSSVYLYVHQLEKQNDELTSNPRTKTIYLPPVHDTKIDSSGKQALREENNRLSNDLKEKTDKLLSANSDLVASTKSKNKWEWMFFGLIFFLLIILGVYFYAKK